MCGKMAVSMKVIIDSIRSTVKALTPTLTEASTKVSGKKECSMESDVLLMLI